MLVEVFFNPSLMISVYRHKNSKKLSYLSVDYKISIRTRGIIVAAYFAGTGGRALGLAFGDLGIGSIVQWHFQTKIIGIAVELIIKHTRAPIAGKFLHVNGVATRTPGGKINEISNFGTVL